MKNQKYLIQYRSFLPTVISNYELHARRKGEDNEAEFRDYAEYQKMRYLRFLERWCNASASGSTFIRVSYECLTSSPVETLSELILQFQPDLEVDRDRLDLTIRNLAHRSLEKARPTLTKWTGVANIRDVQAFRYYDRDLFEALDRDTREVFDWIEARAMIVKIPN